MGEILKTFKGFNQNMTCRDKQYEVGKEYEEREAVACNSGMHACEYPLDCFSYYPPGSSVYHEVEQSGTLSKHNDDTKVASTKMRIGARLDVAGLVRASIEYTKARTTFEHTDPVAATAGNYGAATAGNYGAATAGYKGAATAGDSGAATAGYKGAATAGNYGAATSRGKSATGKNGLSVAKGNNVMVKGGIGAVLVICEEKDDSYDIKEWKVAVVDGETIKADTWYKLENGEFKEIEER